MSSIFDLPLALLLPSTFQTMLGSAGATLLVFAPRRRRVRRFGATLVGVGAGGVAALLLLPVDLWLLRPLESQFPPTQAPPHVDGVTVIGDAVSGAISADGAAPTLNRNADRLTALAILARSYPQARVVFAGTPAVSVPGTLIELEASPVLLERLGVARGRVLYDDQSSTTWENAVNALALGQPKPGETWVLVTSASQMPRAMGASRGAGWPTVLPWPVAYRTTKVGWPALLQPAATRLMMVNLAAYEWAGLAAYRLRGHTDRLFPEPGAGQQP